MFLKDISELAIACIEQIMVEYNLLDYVVLPKSKHSAKLGQYYWNFIWGKASKKAFSALSYHTARFFGNKRVEIFLINLKPCNKNEYTT